VNHQVEFCTSISHFRGLLRSVVTIFTNCQVTDDVQYSQWAQNTLSKRR